MRSDLQASKRPYNRWRWLGIVILLGVLLSAFLLSLGLGSVAIPLSDVVTILTGGTPSKASWQDILWQFRFPKALTALCAGAALAMSGLQLQTLFGNPLAGPSILGVNAGASLGVALVVLTVGATASPANLGELSFLSDLGVVMAASLGSATTLGIMLFVAQQVRNNIALLILGVMIGAATTALVTVLLHFSPIAQTQAYLTWTFGSFAGVTWDQLGLFGGSVGLGFLLALALVKPLNLLLLGETHAQSLGVNVGRVRVGILVSASILAGTVTAFCGPIAFLGIAVPHLCRRLFRTADHQILVPATLLMGSILALLADAIAQLPGRQAILPLNAITALLGAPVVIWLILQQSQLFRGE